MVLCLLAGLRRRLVNEFAVLKMLGLQQLQQRVTKQTRISAIVEPEAYFVQVGLQMLCANPMPRSDEL